MYNRGGAFARMENSLNRRCETKFYTEKKKLRIPYRVAKPSV